MLTIPNFRGVRGHTGRDDEGGSGIDIVSVVNTRRDARCHNGGDDEGDSSSNDLLCPSSTIPTPGGIRGVRMVGVIWGMRAIVVLQCSCNCQLVPYAVQHPSVLFGPLVVDLRYIVSLVTIPTPGGMREIRMVGVIRGVSAIVVLQCSCNCQLSPYAFQHFSVLFGPLAVDFRYIVSLVTIPTPGGIRSVITVGVMRVIEVWIYCVHRQQYPHPEGSEWRE